MVGKRIALFNTSPHATHAQASLAETLRTMSVAFMAEASMAIELPRGESDDALVASEDVSRALRAALATLVAASD
jgi:hypothetical protein